MFDLYLPLLLLLHLYIYMGLSEFMKSILGVGL